MVSEISLGSWLTYGGGVERERAEACVAKAFEVGIDFIDTANVYSRGQAEEFLGEVLADRPRDSYVLATKLFWHDARRRPRPLARAGLHAARRLAAAGSAPTTSTSTSATATTGTRRSRRRWRR